jgi:hypothetical protein
VKKFTRPQPTIEGHLRQGFPAFRYGGGVDGRNTKPINMFGLIPAEKPAPIHQIATIAGTINPFAHTPEH